MPDLILDPAKTYAELERFSSIVAYVFTGVSVIPEWSLAGRRIVEVPVGMTVDVGYVYYNGVFAPTPIATGDIASIPRIVPAGDTTPDVSLGMFYQHTNTSPTVVTNLIGITPGSVKIVYMLLDVYTTYQHNATLKLRGNADVSGNTDDVLALVGPLNGIWYQISADYTVQTGAGAGGSVWADGVWADGVWADGVWA